MSAPESLPVRVENLWPREAPGRQSTSLGALAGALAKAQAKIKSATKDATNPHFGSRYADLASVWEACREALTEHGLAVVQLPVGEGDRVGLTTTLLHASGEWMSSTVYTTPERRGPQALGSVLTYLRRYSLAAMVGVAPDDDDGNAAEPERAPAPANDNGRRVATKLATPKPADPPPAGTVPPSSSEKMASVPQMRKYHALREGMGISEDEGRERVSRLLGRKVESITEITHAEMGRVIDKMEAAGNGAA